MVKKLMFAAFALTVFSILLVSGVLAINYDASVDSNIYACGNIVASGTYYLNQTIVNNIASVHTVGLNEIAGYGSYSGKDCSLEDCNGADITGDNLVNLNDFARIGSNWGKDCSSVNCEGVNFDERCLVVNADDVIIEGNGFSITQGQKSGWGIFVENQENITLKNLVISLLERGVYLKNSNDVFLSNNALSDNWVDVFSFNSVIINDTAAPTIEAPVGVVAEATGVLTSVTLGSPIVTDDRDPSPVVTNDAPASFPIGVTSVTWTATDASGNSATDVQLVNITDTTAPVTTADTHGYVNGTWTKDNVTITFTCEDFGRCDSTTYYINGVSQTHSFRVSSLSLARVSDEVTFTISEPGYYAVTYSSLDTYGNMENNKTLIVKITASDSNGGSYEFPDDGSTPDNATSFTLFEDLTINATSADGNVSQIILSAGTVITRNDSSNINLSELSANGNSSSFSLTGLGSGLVVEGALQWGIVNLGLEFSQPITLKIYLGSAYEGKTLGVWRSTSGSSGWTQDGIVAPATCTVTAGICEFNATKASYYATTSGSPTTTVSAGTSGSIGSGRHATATNNAPANVTETPVNENTETEATTPTGTNLLTGAVTGLIGNPAIWIPLVFVIIVVIAYFVVSARRKGKKAKKKE